MSRPSTAPSSRMSPLLVVTVWAYRRLLALHPAGFRREYADSIQQVFRQTCLDAYRSHGSLGVARLWLPALADLLYGALAEHAALLTQSLKGSSYMLQYRRSASAIFAAFIGFVIVGIGFGKMSEDIMKSSLPIAYPLLRVSYDALLVGSVVALLAVLAGGIPVALASLRFAFSRRRVDILARFAVPPIALIAIIATAFVVHIYDIGGSTPATLHTPARIGALGAIGVVFVLGAIASTYAVLSAIARSDISEPLLRFTLLPGVLATAAMLAMVGAHIVWSFVLWQDAPSHFFGNDGILASSTLAAMVVQVLVMAIAALIALRALVQGIAARRDAPRLA